MNQLQSALVDALMSAGLVGFLHGLLPSLLPWGCQPLSAGCVAQREGGEADVRCEYDGADVSLAGYSSLLFKIHSLAPLPKQLRLCTWLIEVGIVKFSRGAWRNCCHQTHGTKHCGETLLGIGGQREG